MPSCPDSLSRARRCLETSAIARCHAGLTRYQEESKGSCSSCRTPIRHPEKEKALDSRLKMSGMTIGRVGRSARVGCGGGCRNDDSRVSTVMPGLIRHQEESKGLQRHAGPRSGIQKTGSKNPGSPIKNVGDDEEGVGMTEGGMQEGRSKALNVMPDPDPASRKRKSSGFPIKDVGNDDWARGAERARGVWRGGAGMMIQGSQPSCRA